MLAWVSSITHSDSTVIHYHVSTIYGVILAFFSFHFLISKDSVLAEQARQERKDPLWPMLQKATEGSDLLIF